jgi:hypothetical protein
MTLPNREIERESKEPVFMQHRYKLDAPTAQRLPANSYNGSYTVESFLASPPVNTWLKKKTRGLRVFYFFPPEAAKIHRLQQKKVRLAERSGEESPETAPSYVYLPLDPGYMLWFAVEVPKDYTPTEAVTEALWSPISADATRALAWFVAFLDDPSLPMEYTLHENTRVFVRDYDRHVSSGEPMGVLHKYVGDLKNDGSVHKQRRPGTNFPCVV